jgi:hypothetical protein
LTRTALPKSISIKTGRVVWLELQKLPFLSSTTDGGESSSDDAVNTVLEERLVKENPFRENVRVAHSIGCVDSTTTLEIACSFGQLSVYQCSQLLTSPCKTVTGIVLLIKSLGFNAVTFTSFELLQSTPVVFNIRNCGTCDSEMLNSASPWTVKEELVDSPGCGS